MVRFRKQPALPMEVGAVMTGICVSLVINIIMSALFAWLISAEYVQENWVGYGAMLTLMLSSDLGALMGVMKAKSKWLLIASLTAAGYYLSLLVMNILFFDGRLQGVWETALVVMAGAGFVILAGLKEGKTRRTRLRKYKNR